MRIPGIAAPKLRTQNILDSVSSRPQRRQGTAALQKKVKHCVMRLAYATWMACLPRVAWRRQAMRRGAA